jgi:hypothetical protein
MVFSSDSLVSSPAFFGQVLVVDALVREVLLLADPLKLFKQYLIRWGSGAWQHLDLGVLGTKFVPTDHLRT